MQRDVIHGEPFIFRGCIHAGCRRRFVASSRENALADDIVQKIAHSAFHQSRTLGIPKCPDCFGELIYLASR